METKVRTYSHRVKNKRKVYTVGNGDQNGNENIANDTQWEHIVTNIAYRIQHTIGK